MVAGPGIAPRTGAYETPEILLLHPAANLVDRRGFEPRTLECKSSAFPITPSAQILVDAVGVEPTVPGAGDLQSPGVTSFPTHPYNLLYTLPAMLSTSSLSF